MGVPIRRGQAGPEDGFDPAVDPFDHAIGLGMKGSGGYGGNIEEGTNGGPEGRSKLGTLVRSEMGWDPKTGDPRETESRSAGRSSGG